MFQVPEGNGQMQCNIACSLAYLLMTVQDAIIGRLLREIKEVDDEMTEAVQ
jgi:hypothetical protein